MKNKTIIYKLIVEDIQTVAKQELGRKLSSDEILEIIDAIAEKINWYDAIADTINEELATVNIENRDTIIVHESVIQKAAKEARLRAGIEQRQ